jgi:Cu2+-exporting ATPase
MVAAAGNILGTAPIADDGAMSLCHHCGLPAGSRAIQEEFGGELVSFCCHGCVWVARLMDGGEGTNPLTGTRLRLALGIFFALNAMVFSLAHYGNLLGADQSSAGALSAMDMQRWAQMLFTMIVFALLGLPFLARLADLFRAKAGGLDGLVAIGVLAALLLSVANTLRGSGEIYFDGVNALLILVTLGKLLEASARSRAFVHWSQLRAPATGEFRVERGVERTTVALDELRVGDLVEVHAGETVPVDGAIERGSAFLRREWLTGESIPRSAGRGDEVLAGFAPVDGSLWIRARATGSERESERLRSRLEAARRQRPTLLRAGDRAARWLLPIALFAAVVAALLGYRAAGAVEATERALAALVVACPCAMGIAAPLAFWLGWAAPARFGVWLDGPDVVERLAGIRAVLFDKTGTLTEAEDSQVALQSSPDAGWELETLRAITASLQRHSRHPFARPLSALSDREIEFTEIQHLPARGLQATWDSHAVHLGSAALMSELGIVLAQEDVTSEGPMVFLAIDRELQLRIQLDERLRFGAGPALRGLATLHVSSHVASGDQAGRVEALARLLPLDSHRAAMKPEEKLALVARLAEAGGVAMVGDGLNDSLALAGASVGIALGHTADLTRDAAHVHALDASPAIVPALIRHARRVRGIVLQNFAWAIGFNLAALSAAALGVLHPILAAVLMAMSSFVVLANSQRARHFRCPPRTPEMPEARS